MILPFPLIQYMYVVKTSFGHILIHWAKQKKRYDTNILKYFYNILWSLGEM
jgi:hypothetical protein